MSIVRGQVKLQKYAAVVLIALAYMFSTEFVFAEVDANKARVHYMLNCQGCHMHDGSRSPVGDIPEMKNYVGNFLRVPGGREFLVQVPGSANAPLSDGQLANLLNWILMTIGGQSTPTDFVHYTEEEIAVLRPMDLLDVAATRAQLVKKINAVVSE